MQFKSTDKNATANDSILPEGFSVVSADNIDFMLRFARVFQGNKNASWHGTSVQVVQPIPGLSECTEETDLLLNPQDIHSGTDQLLD